MDALWSLLSAPYDASTPVSERNPTRGRLLVALLRKTGMTAEAGESGVDGQMSAYDKKVVARFFGIQRDTVAPTCAVPFCGHEEDEDQVLLPVCRTHHMHRACLVSYLKNAREPVCPMCRDPLLRELRNVIQETPYEAQVEEFDQTWLTDEMRAGGGPGEVLMTFELPPQLMLGDPTQLLRSMMGLMQLGENTMEDHTPPVRLLRSFTPPSPVVTDESTRTL